MCRLRDRLAYVLFDELLERAPQNTCLGNADRPGTFLDDQIELSTLYGQMLPRQIFFQTLVNTTKNRPHALRGENRDTPRMNRNVQPHAGT